MSTDLIGSGETYTTVALWWADIPAVLLENETGRITNTAEISTSANTDLSGKTVGAFSITLEANTGQGFGDNANKLTNAQRYVAANGAAWTNSGNNTMITIGANPIMIRGLQLKKQADYQRMLQCTDGGVTITFENLIIEGSVSDGTAPLVDVRTTVINDVLIIDRSGDATQPAIYLGGTTTAFNCIFARTAAATNRVGVDRYAGTATFTNCGVFGFASNWTGTVGGSNNASDLAISFGSNNQASLTYANQFQSITASSEDYRSKSGAALIGNGTSSGAPSADIVGTSWGGTVDIGIWKFASGAGPSIPVLLASSERRGDRR